MCASYRQSSQGGSEWGLYRTGQPSSPLDAHRTLLVTRALPVFLCGAAATVSRVG